MPKASGSSRLGLTTSPVPLSRGSAHIKTSGQRKLDRYLKCANANNNHNKENGQDKTTPIKSKPIFVSRDEEKAASTNSDSSTVLTTQYLYDKISSLEKQLAEATSHNQAIKNNQTMITTQLRATVKRQTLELQQVKSNSENRMMKAVNIIEQLIREESFRRSTELRQQLASDGARLGRLVTTRRGGLARVIETWEDGEEPTKLKKRRDALKRRREGVKKRWAELTQKCDTIDINEVFGNEFSNLNVQENDLDKIETQETIRMHLEELNREERKLEEEDRALSLEKRKHVRMLKLVANEDSSKFRFRHKVRSQTCSTLDITCFNYLRSSLVTRSLHTTKHVGQRGVQ